MEAEDEKRVLKHLVFLNNTGNEYEIVVIDSVFEWLTSVDSTIFSSVFRLLYLQYISHVMMNALPSSCSFLFLFAIN